MTLGYRCGFPRPTYFMSVLWEASYRLLHNDESLEIMYTSILGDVCLNDFHKLMIIPFRYGAFSLRY